MMRFRLELVTVPVSDVDRAKAFYVEQAGFVADQDHRVDDALRFVQLTPPGSGCSIAIGEGLTDAPPGSAPNLQLVVDDADAALAQLRSRGVQAGDVQDLPYGRMVFFSDPDGNRWAVQELPPRPPAIPRHARLVAHEGKGRELAERLLAAAAELEADPGCQLYMVNRDAADEDTVWVTELWRRPEDLQAAQDRVRGSEEVAATMALVRHAEMIELELLGGKRPVATG